MAPILDASGRPMSRTRVTPMREMGTAGFRIYSGYVDHAERDAGLKGDQRWRTFADIATNTSIVAAGVRLFLELVASVEWSTEAAEDVAGADEAAEFVERAMDDLATGWSRLIRRLCLYRFHGFVTHEWIAIRRGDGAINFRDIEVRPVETIERWDVDEFGAILGVWQESPQTLREHYIPRGKLVYLVDDTLTDNPEGLGLFRHLAEPAARLKRYLNLEKIGFERDFRGLPVGRAPLLELQQAVREGKLTAEESNVLVESLYKFVRMQMKAEDSSIVLDSAPYKAATDTGVAWSSTPKWGVDLITGQTNGLEEAGAAINRINRELARIIGVEQIMLGEGSGSRSLSEDKSRNLYMIANAVLRDLAEALNRDFVGPLWRLNGFPDEARPKLRPATIDPRSAGEIAATLRDMATAGAVLQPDDPAIDEVREIMGLSGQPEVDPEMMGAMRTDAASIPGGIPAGDGEAG